MGGPLNFAVIGCGAISRAQHLPNIVRSKRARLHVCCDRDEAVLRQCADAFKPARVTTDFRDAVNDPDVHVICLATTEKVRLPVVESAARVRKPLYIEKPLASTLDEVRKIEQIVKQSGIPLCIGHNRRCSPAMIEANAIYRRHMRHPRPSAWRWDREGGNRRPLKEDGVGAISVRVNDDWWSWKGWALDKSESPHGAMLFEMTHFTDVCNWFLDAQAEEVVALESGELNHGIVIRYKTGEMATISMMANGTFAYPKELYEATGQGGIVVIDHMVEVRTAGIEGAPARKNFPMLNDKHAHVKTDCGGIFDWLAKKRVACEDAAAAGDPMRQFTSEPDKGHAHAIERFIDEITGAGPTVCGIDDAVAATRIAFAAIRSVVERRIVRLDEI
jgi:predicted dehydrogenase